MPSAGALVAQPMSDATASAWAGVGSTYWPSCAHGALMVRSQGRPFRSSRGEYAETVLGLSCDGKGISMRADALRDATRKQAEEAKRDEVRGDPTEVRASRPFRKRMATVTAVWDQTQLQWRKSEMPHDGAAPRALVLLFVVARKAKLVLRGALAIWQLRGVRT